MQLPDLQPWFDKFDTFVLAIPARSALAAFFIPIVFALFSRRTVVFLGCLLLATIALSILLHPGSTASIVVFGAYFGGILLAVSGIKTSRQASNARTELMSLRTEMNEMRNIEERRYLVELKRDRRKQRNKNSDKDKDSDPQL